MTDPTEAPDDVESALHKALQEAFPFYAMRPVSEDGPPRTEVFSDGFRAGFAASAAQVADLKAEILRLRGWLEKIEGGDRPCFDEAELRQWAYEAHVLGKQP